jgi:hypothetical protein
MTTDPMQEIVNVAPGYASALEQLRQEWEPETPGLCLELGALVWWIAERVQDGEIDFGVLGAVMERLLTTSDPVVRDAVSTCFFESLVNRVPEVIPSSVAESLLGPESRSVAQSWLEF